MEFDTFVVVVIVVMVMAFILSIGRRGGGETGGRMCAGCGAIHPPQAQFCRRCGQKL